MAQTNLVVDVKSEKWYEELISDLSNILENTYRNTVIGYHALGKRILDEYDNFERVGIYGHNISQHVAKCLAKSQRTIDYAIQFARKYPDLSSLPEGVSWHDICNNLLPESKAHVSYNSGNNEWYTPPEYIEAARDVLGGIDLDPASTATANAVIGAKEFFTPEDDGLAQEWHGRVWMNPPYASALIGKFTEKMAQSFKSGKVTEAIVLVNNATETSWFRELIDVASAVCFPGGRVKFWSPDRDSATPLQGQALIYLGKKADIFRREFDEFGWTATL